MIFFAQIIRGTLTQHHLKSRDFKLNLTILCTVCKMRFQNKL